MAGKNDKLTFEIPGPTQLGRYICIKTAGNASIFVSLLIIIARMFSGLIPSNLARRMGATITGSRDTVPPTFEGLGQAVLGDATVELCQAKT